MKQNRSIWCRILLLLCVCSLLLCACHNKDPENGETSEAPQSTTNSPSPILPSPIPKLGNGLSLSISQAETQELDISTVATLVGSMNLQTVQIEACFVELLDDTGVLRSGVGARYGSWFDALRAEGVVHIVLTVTGGTWGSEYNVDDPHAFPYPDSEQESQYTDYLKLYQTGFASLAAAFPQVGYFQAGKNFNLSEYAHAVKDRSFTVREKAALAVDLSHAARQGVQSVRNDAQVVFSGCAADIDAQGAADYLRQCYRYMREGRSPNGTLAASSCFDVMAWTPYLNWYAFDANGFVSENAVLYQALQENGSGSTPVLLSGFGFCDYGSQSYDIQQSGWLEDLCSSISSKMPYVSAFYPGSLLEAGESAEESEIYGGLFRVFDKASFGAKEKAEALCILYKGEKEELNQFKYDHEVYEKDPNGNPLNGIGFAIKGAEERSLNIDKIMDLLEVMNVQSLRNWMNIRTLLTSPTKINQREVALQKQWIAQLNRRGINKIVGMSQGAFWPEETKIQDESAVPYRDLEEGSLYLAFLETYEQSWYTLASTFPEIEYWEVGNETNSNNFLHPLDFSTTSKTFTTEEKALITADMCYTAAKAIRRANPDAVVIFPAMAPLKGFDSMSSFLNRVYSCIEGGKCIGGTNPDDYFDAMSWHCYYFSTSFTPENWLEGNNSVYQVMVDHGDGDKKVFLTEFGFSDGGKQEQDALQATYFREIFKLAEQMPYLDSLYPFRTIEDETAASWGGEIEIYYGMFRVFDAEHFGAKEKAKVICELYGGDLSKLDQFSGGMTVYPR